MECSDKRMFSLLGTMIFTGWTVAAFFVPRLSDLYGRKITFLVNMAIQSLAILAMIFAKSFVIMAVALFVVGMCSSARWTVSYVYLMEFLTEDTIKCVGPFVNASAALAFVIAAFTLQVLTKETIVLEYAALFISTLAVILTIFFLPESPKWLVNSDQMNRAKDAYKYIAEVNGRHEVVNELDQWTFQKQSTDEKKSGQKSV